MSEFNVEAEREWVDACRFGSIAHGRMMNYLAEIERLQSRPGLPDKRELMRMMIAAARSVKYPDVTAASNARFANENVGPLMAEMEKEK